MRIELLASGQARTELAYMPAAPIAAARRALAMAGIGIKDLAAIKSHNPFALNDIIFARETGADLETMNNYGCSLDLGSSPGADWHAYHHRVDRRMGAARRWLWAVSRLCRWR